MPLTGLQIYKLLPQTNCKECGYPTCLAFAMKLAAQQAELALCPYVSEESKQQLESASSPPIRLITLSRNNHQIAVGNETVLFRHEKTFYGRPGLFVRLKDTMPPDEISKKVLQVASYSVEYVGVPLQLDGLAVEAAMGDGATFASCVQAVVSQIAWPLILIASAPQVMAAGLEKAEGVSLLYAADESNWPGMVEVAKSHGAPLAVRAQGLEALVSLTQKVRDAGMEDIVLDPGTRGFSDSLVAFTQIRRLALKKNFRPLGYPIITFPGESASSLEEEILLAGQHIAKYAGFVVLEHFTPASAYPLLVLRQNIYTDPQKPIQVQPGVYEINQPQPDSPVLVTTNFSITYFSVANEVEGAGFPAWLIVVDAEGMSVLTAWAAGKFDAERIAKAVRTPEIESRINHKKIVIPGHVAVLLGELEEELPGWEIRVGPREAVDLPSYLKQWK